MTWLLRVGWRRSRVRTPWLDVRVSAREAGQSSKEATSSSPGWSSPS